MVSRIKLCTFDLTNTLLKFRYTVGDLYAKVGRIYGVERDPRILGVANAYYGSMMEYILPNYGKTKISCKDWWKEVVRGTFKTETSELTDKELVYISDHLYEFYKTKECYTVTTGAKSLLRSLKEKQVVLGIISNFDDRQDCALKSTELHSYFDFTLASYDVNVKKPDCKIFDIALGKVPLISASEALHIGDHAVHDYFAPKMAGWNAMLFREYDLKFEKEIILQFVHPKDIVQYLSDIEQLILYY